MSTSFDKVAVLPPLPLRERVGVRGTATEHSDRCSPLNRPLTLALSYGGRGDKSARYAVAGIR